MGEIGRTDEAIAAVRRTLKLFRPPYGRWGAKIAGQLNWTGAWPYIGPVMWDIDAGDWQFWRNGRSARECAVAYIDAIQRAGRGIVLMHDSSFEEDIRVQNQTFQAAKLMVNWLMQNDYHFVRLDSVPQVVRAAHVGSVRALQTATGHYLSPQDGGGGQVLANAPGVGPCEPLGVIELGDEKIALRCLTGHYLSAQNGGGGSVVATAPAIGPWELLTRVDLPDGRIALCCASGHYISPQSGGGGEIVADRLAIAEWEALRTISPN
jgi:hypothetical protein